MTIAPAAPTDTLSAILAARGDSLAACELCDWLHGFREVPDDAAPPLAMSGPHPRAVGSYGAECIAWAKAELGITLRWWQALAVTRQLEHDEDGALVWREVIESGPRRIGKSVRLRVVALWRTANAARIGEKQLSMLVSKDLAVGKEIHRGAWRWAESKSWKVVRLNGGQEVESPDESRWLLRADTAVYGYDVGYGQVDESWGVDPQSITDGLEPALLERLWSQLHLTSTAHVKATSLMRRRMIAALRNADPDVLLLLWGAHPDSDYADETTWRASSPHWSKDRRDLMARKYAAALAGQDEPEFDDPDPVRGWAAQYLNVWPGLLDRSSSIMPHWPDRSTQTASGPVSGLGVAIDIGQVWVSLGSSTGGDRPHVGTVLRVKLATQRAHFVSEVARIHKATGVPVAMDSKGPGAALLGKALSDAGVVVTYGGLDEYVLACEDFSTAVETDGLEHGDYPELNDAVDAATWRMAGDRRVFGRKTGDISALEAAVWAKWVGAIPTFNVW